MNKNSHKLIGISGLSRSGKNSFANLLELKLKDKFKVKQLSLAYFLRVELQDILRDNFSLDVWSQKTEEKNLFRNILVYWAEIRRKQSNGTYFWKKLENQAKQLNALYDVFIINDVRFKEYPEDEVDFIKKNGVLVHIKKYHISSPDSERVYFSPPNEKEALNDPILQKNADWLIEWPEINSNDLEFQNKELGGYVDRFLEGCFKKIIK